MLTSFAANSPAVYRASTPPARNPAIRCLSNPVRASAQATINSAFLACARAKTLRSPINSSINTRAAPPTGTFALVLPLPRTYNTTPTVEILGKQFTARNRTHV